MATSKPTKVVIEITAQGWTERVYAGEAVIAETAYVMESRGSARSSDNEEWYERLPDEFADLAEALDDLSSGPFEVAGSLYGIEEEWP